MTYFLSPDYLKIVSECMDYTNDKERKTLLSIDEADQNKVLLSLTDKLYSIITDKASSVDFGKIPNTKGDVTKLDGYDTLTETLDIIAKICNEYRQPDISRIPKEALNNLIERKDIFERAFKLGIEFPIMIYNTIYLAIINATSLTIAACIEYVKSPAEETFNIALDKVGVAKSQERLLYDNLEKFNKTCANGQLDKALEAVIKQNVKNLSGIDDVLVFGGGLMLVTLIFNIIPIVRELIFFFFYTRVTVSEFFEYQSDLLVMNAYNLEYNSTLSATEKKKIKSKQLAIADKFKKVSNFIAIDAKQAEVKATKEIKAAKKEKVKLNDLSVKNDLDHHRELPDNNDVGSSSSVLF